jgi:hypothetical protein
VRQVDANRLATQSQGTHPFPQHQRRVSVALTDDEAVAAHLQALVNLNQEMTRLRRQAFNYANPVDDYEAIGVGAASVTIRTEFDISVLYESLMFSLPVGVTSATLQIGTNRAIQLYSGAAIVNQQLQVLPYLRMTAVPNDRRTLTLTGAGTTQGYIGLMGHALEREGDR